MALAAAVLCVLFASCDKDNDDIIPSSDDKEATYYDYSENGFFMNGDIKIRGYFDRDSIMEGYTKYVRRTAHYRTVDGEEGEFVFGYGLVVGINDLARFYSDDITYNADSTAIISGVASSSSATTARAEAVCPAPAGSAPIDTIARTRAAVTD